jgi:NAD(P)-dependent dehydrogenase (short-subunit alcohol dehydrogenase family)
LRARGAGRILNVTSTAAYEPTPLLAACGASKASIVNFSEALTPSRDRRPDLQRAHAFVGRGDASFGGRNANAPQIG